MFYSSVHELVLLQVLFSKVSKLSTGNSLGAIVELLSEKWFFFCVLDLYMYIQVQISEIITYISIHITIKELRNIKYKIK